MRRILSEIPLNYGVRKALRILKNEACHVGAISTSLSPLADRLSSELDLEFAFSEQIEHNNGKLTGEISAKVAPANKHILLREVARKMRIPLSSCVAVGDNWVDARMLEFAGFGIAFSPTDAKVKEAADVIVQRNFLKIVDQILLWRDR